jgi:hypothetical protein
LDAAKQRNGKPVNNTAKGHYTAGIPSDWDTSTLINALIGFNPALVSDGDQKGRAMDGALRKAQKFRNDEYGHRGNSMVPLPTFEESVRQAKALLDSILTYLGANDTITRLQNTLLPEIMEEGGSSDEKMAQYQAKMQEVYEQWVLEEEHRLHAEREEIEAEIAHQENLAQVDQERAQLDAQRAQMISQHELAKLRARHDELCRRLQ